MTKELRMERRGMRAEPIRCVEVSEKACRSKNKTKAKRIQLERNPDRKKIRKKSGRIVRGPFDLDPEYPHIQVLEPTF